MPRLVLGPVTGKTARKPAARKAAQVERQELVHWAEDAHEDRVLIRSALDALPRPPRVVFLPDGAELLRAVARERPDLVVLDVNMPVLDGIETLRRLRARPATRDLPVVVFSTARHERDLAATEGLGVRAFLQKPTRFDEFAAAVERIVSSG